MQDFTHNDLFLKAVIAERQRQALATACCAVNPAGAFRSRLARRLAAIAVRLDRDVPDPRMSGKLSAGHRA